MEKLKIENKNLKKVLIGIDASRAFLSQRTGIEEYSFQVIKELTAKLGNQLVILYVRPEQAGASLGFPLPENWRLKPIKLPYFWTQIGLSLEMFFHPVDILFVPGHVAPLIHPKKTIVTVHGLEYEILPWAYSFWERLYMRLSIQKSCSWANKIVVVSENTKKDLMALYKIPMGKIEVIYEGVMNSFKSSGFNSKINQKYLLFIGRLEERKNIIGILRAFEILKEHYKIPHQLILAGKFGYGEEKIKNEIKNINFHSDIILPGFVSEEEKRELLKNADVFLFPTFYEGFGLPILEAQSVGTPVVASDNSSISEVAGGAAILVDPANAEQIADATYKILKEENFRESLIAKGLENVKKFSWEKCAEEISRVLLKD